MTGYWALLWGVNAVAFAFYLQRREYGRLWLALVAALLIGPLIWLWWGYLTWRETDRGDRFLRRRGRSA
jgi:hypothetical protein